MAISVIAKPNGTIDHRENVNQLKFQCGCGQDPIAIVGLACRLPGRNNTPTELWRFLRNGEQAGIEPPPSRFNPAGHYNGSSNGRSMVMPGGMFLEDVDLRDLDAKFFKLSNHEAQCMDPQQRQLLEVVYEGLENAGISLQELRGQPYGCFVGSYACDYGDAQNRDPEERASAYAVGVGRAMLSNRISHFLDLKGPSMTIDTACSGSLIALDTACRYLQTKDVAGAIVGACNLYLSPEHAMDSFAINGAGSPTGRCHTFDAKADGYIKSEAVNMVILKRLEDAIRDNDPIRAVIRGSATNSDGWTAGIASPNAVAQATVIKQAYINAGISDLTSTSYIECHGTGTKAGDVIEVEGLAKVFSRHLSSTRPLRIGSIKSNIGHSEPAAGLSGLIKVILSLENSEIPGNPTFKTPNPKIDFQTLKFQVSNERKMWPTVPFRRAGVSSFGYGGSNVHAIVDEAGHALVGMELPHISSYVNEDTVDIFDERRISDRPYVLVFSANEEQSLRTYLQSLDRHLSYPGVKVQLNDLAYTLSERRTHHFHRAYLITNECSIDRNALVFGKMRSNPRIGLVFTGQGAQWPQMGLSLCEHFPIAREVIKSLDKTLRSLSNGPCWSAYDELTSPRSKSHIQLPEFSQPLVTILQIAILSVLKSWGIEWCAVTGHSSGEIACAVAAGLLSPEEAVKVAYYRGLLSDSLRSEKKSTGMLAVGLGSYQAKQYISSAHQVDIACFNSPSTCTLSGEITDLEKIQANVTGEGHFARMLLVDLAYHSRFIRPAASHYEELLRQNCLLPNPSRIPSPISMFSSVTGGIMNDCCDTSYWVNNMVSPVKFREAVEAMQTHQDSPDILIEIGPSGGLAGPLSQIRQCLPDDAKRFEYLAAYRRGESSGSALFDLAGKLFISGSAIDFSEVNRNSKEHVPRTIVDLPNYAWDHRTKFWKENESSKDWRFRRFIHHDLLGSKILGVPWTLPVWKKSLGTSHVPWLKDHMLGSDIVFPAAGYIAMAVEAIFQKSVSLASVDPNTSCTGLSYRLRDVSFSSALVFTMSGSEEKLTLTLYSPSGDKDSWHNFKISSSLDGVVADHCSGQIRVLNRSATDDYAADLTPLRHALPASMWYKAMKDVGYSFGPAFQKQLEIESACGSRNNRARLSLLPSKTEEVESSYPLHPTVLDSCFQSGAASLWQGLRASVDELLIPSHIDNLTIIAQESAPVDGIAISSAEYVGIGSKYHAQNYATNTRVYNSEDGHLLLKMTGLHYSKLETRNDARATPMYACVDWHPDISLASRDQFEHVVGEINIPESGVLQLDKSDRLRKIMDLVLHKRPKPRILELNLLARSNSLWLDIYEHQGLNFRECHIFLSTHEAVLDAQERYRSIRGTGLRIAEFTDFAQTSVEEDELYDVLTLSMQSSSRESLETTLEDVGKILRKDGILLLLIHEAPYNNSMPVPNGNAVKSFDHNSNLPSIRPFRPPFLALKVHANNDHVSVYITTALLENKSPSFTEPDIHFAHFSSPAKGASRVMDQIGSSNYHSIQHHLPFTSIPPQSTVVVLTEIDVPFLARMTSDQWDGLKYLIIQQCRILWVTAGSQMDVANPDQGMAAGLMRTLRNENPGQAIVTLDVDSRTPDYMFKPIGHMIGCLNGAVVLEDCEYVERSGVLHVSRVKQDEELNGFENALISGAEPYSTSFHNHPRCIRLTSSRVGTLDSLHYTEVSTEEIPLQQDFAEIEVHAASMNFKDVATVMGLVPADASLIGLDGAGIIRRFHPEYTGPLHVGQRVLVTRKGCFSNLVQTPVDGLHPLPDWMTFEDASTLPSVYRVCVYGLLDLANLRQGQSILIHSGAGGVGIAAIQICQHYGLKIYTTVGSNHKRKFLTETYGISDDRIFSSRTTEFASKLMRATNGKGVDIVLNSLSGDMLDESWRCIAQDGNFIEIGKKDLVNRGSLSMEPFCRNVSYRAIDMSLDNIPWPETQRLLRRIFKMIEDGIIKPINPRKIYSFADIVDAFRDMRSGNHIGKIVISDGADRTCKVLVQPAVPLLQLDPSAAYIIVGGLRGLCGSIAILLAQHGAKYLITMSRSDQTDERSQSVLFNLKSLGAEVQCVKGDVTVMEDVQRLFGSSARPIKGIIQGAMVLRDKIFSSMSIQEWQQCIRCKVQGTWNLHNASLQHNSTLDFFLLLSSLSGIVGHLAQANYAAANAFLNSFAIYRQKLGLRACSVDLGAIEDVGYLSERTELAERVDARSFSGINENQLHKIIYVSILQQTHCTTPVAIPSEIVTGIIFPQPSDSSLRHDVRFASLFGTSYDTSSHSNDDTGSSRGHVQAFLNLLKAETSRNTLVGAALELMNRQLMKLLRLDEPIEVDRPLSGYGIDSLTAVEFRNWMRTELGVESTTLEIIGAKTLNALCEGVVAKLIAGNEHRS